MKQFYKEFKFQRSTLRDIAAMNDIIKEYTAGGFVLTVRQLYYQLVARNIIPNTEKSYKRTTSVVNDARLAGLMDWDAIEDRTRSFVRRPSWTSGASILESAAHSFHMDMWNTQSTRPVVIIEKEALAGVMEGICHELDVPLLAARGYPSGTVLRDFAKTDMLKAYRNGQSTTFLHFGDHDPSGIDMSRDLEERLTMFGEYKCAVEFKRIALNMEQIDELKPPPNPAKSTDARFQQYYELYGSESWELDALNPEFLIGLVRDNVEQYIDFGAWDERKQEIDDIKARIAKVAEGF